MSICFSYSYLKALIIFIWILDISNSERVEGQLPDLSVIPTLFNIFAKPYLRTWKSKSPILKVFEETPIEKIVRLKILELQPFLQDNDFNTPEVDDFLTLEGNDETTIVELLPKTGAMNTGLREGNDPFKSNVRKYKNVRNKINKALDKESVSDKTKTLIIKTLDDLIRRMIETRCNWKGGTNIDTVGKQGDDNQLIIPRTIVNTWSRQWNEFKNKFARFVNNKPLAQRDGSQNMENLIEYLNNINVILNDVSENLDKFSRKYKIKCNVYERKRSNVTSSSTNKPDVLRNKLSYDTDSEKNVCKHFQVCSKELKSFLIEFYNSLNDTVVNVVRSYGEMFTRDVHTDVSNEKDNIVSLIFAISNVAEKAITKVFSNKISELKLDKYKNKEANVEILTYYIKNVVKDAKQEVRRILISELSYLHEKIASSIVQDIVVNLRVELGNLERDMIGKICFVFNVCNGKTSGRRFNEIWTNYNDNKIYVKVEVTLDDEMKDAISNNLLMKNKELEPGKLNQSNHNEISTSGRPNTILIDYAKYATMDVTRTTLLS